MNVFGRYVQCSETYATFTLSHEQLHRLFANMQHVVRGKCPLHLSDHPLGDYHKDVDVYFP